MLKPIPDKDIPKGWRRMLPFVGGLSFYTELYQYHDNRTYVEIRQENKKYRVDILKNGVLLKQFNSSSEYPKTMSLTYAKQIAIREMRRLSKNKKKKRYIVKWKGFAGHDVEPSWKEMEQVFTNPTDANQFYTQLKNKGRDATMTVE